MKYPALLFGATAFFILLPAAMPHGATCSSIADDVKALGEHMSSYCEDVQPSIAWTSTPLTSIGNLNFGSTGTSIYSIPTTVPNSAKEVLVYVFAQVGTASPDDVLTHVKFFTVEGNSEYAKYLGIYTWRNSAWNTNSDNIWLPMPSNRQFHVNLPNSHGGNIGCSFYVIGYR